MKKNLQNPQSLAKTLESYSQKRKLEKKLRDPWWLAKALEFYLSLKKTSGPLEIGEDIGILFDEEKAWKNHNSWRLAKTLEFYYRRENLKTKITEPSEIGQALENYSTERKLANNPHGTLRYCRRLWNFIQWWDVPFSWIYNWYYFIHSNKHKVGKRRNKGTDCQKLIIITWGMGQNWWIYVNNK